MILFKFDISTRAPSAVLKFTSKAANNNFLTAVKNDS